jgi:hypothetical protein
MVHQESRWADTRRAGHRQRRTARHRTLARRFEPPTAASNTNGQGALAGSTSRKRQQSQTVGDCGDATAAIAAVQVSHNDVSNRRRVTEGSDRGRAEGLTEEPAPAPHTIHGMEIACKSARAATRRSHIRGGRKRTIAHRCSGEVGRSRQLARWTARRASRRCLVSRHFPRPA